MVRNYTAPCLLFCTAPASTFKSATKLSFNLIPTLNCSKSELFIKKPTAVVILECFAFHCSPNYNICLHCVPPLSRCRHQGFPEWRRGPRVWLPPVCTFQLVHCIHHIGWQGCRGSMVSDHSALTEGKLSKPRVRKTVVDVHQESKQSCSVVDLSVDMLILPAYHFCGL